MHIFLDHISALLVSAVLVIILVLLQIRGAQSNTEITINHLVRSETLDIAEMLERDLLNMRTVVQTEAAEDAGHLQGGTAFRCSTAIGGASVGQDTTKLFEFPTLVDPQVAAGLTDPDSAEVAIVSYRLIREAGQSVARLMSSGTITHPLYRLERQVSGYATGLSQSTVTFFNVEFGLRDGSFQQASMSDCPISNMSRVRFQIQTARNGVQDIAGDQRAMSQINFSRYGGTVDLINWDL